MFLVRHSLYNPSFFFSFDPYRFLPFLCKTKASCKIYLVLQECVFFRFKMFFHNRWFLLWMCRKKEIQFLFRLGLNAIKWLWYNADTQMLWAFSSIRVNLHSKISVFQYMHLFCVATKYVVLLQLLFLYTSAVFASNYVIMSWYVDSTGSFLGCSERGRKNNNQL